MVWQLCPKCGGDGTVKTQQEITTTGIPVVEVCNLCNGDMIISEVTGLPPSANICHDKPNSKSKMKGDLYSNLKALQPDTFEGFNEPE